MKASQILHLRFSSSSSAITFFSEELNRNIFENNTRKVKQVRIGERTLCSFVSYCFFRSVKKITAKANQIR